ncbi:MAG: MinD/ParA family protein [Lachnospiraceae bacterium]|nr:MinD/ParA family protein [Lachnospiraceae bacterium]
MDQAEKLRNIIKLQNLEQQNQSRIITVTSGKGGVGKSSLAINLAIKFRELGQRVIIFDADFGLANIEVMFGAIPKYNLSDMIFRGKELKDIIINGPMDIGFISGGSGISGLGNMTRDQVAYLVYKLRELETLADIIIIDTGAGISDSVLEFVSASGEVLLVATPEPTSITDAYALLKSLNVRAGFDRESTNIKVVANRVADYEEGVNLYNKLNVVVSKFLNINLDFLGIVPLDNAMSKAVIQQKPLTIAYENAPSAKAIDELARKLLNAPIDEKKKGLAQVVLRLFNKKKDEQ